MAFGIYVSLVICILIQISKPQTTVKLIKGSGETQLSEMNERLQHLEKTMNTVVSDSQQEMQGLRNTLNKVERKIIELNSAVNNAGNQIKELKCALKGINESLEYTVHYTKKNWTDANLSCKAGGGHLVSIETMDEYNHVVELSQKKRCYHPRYHSGFWTSATNVGVDNWVWSNSRERVLDDLWHAEEPSGDGDCGEINEYFATIPFNDVDCSASRCYICENPC